MFLNDFRLIYHSLKKSFMIINHKRLYISAGLVLLTFFLVSIIKCANPVMPSGGLKDTEPPVPVESEPPNFSSGFTGEKIDIKFDEFIQLKDPVNSILISPPVSQKPDYNLRGKSLVIKFAEPLRPNTTYTIFFGNSIVDLNEGNPLENYQFVFSTGETVDSLSIRGIVRNSFNLEPEGEVFLMLYKTDNDTVPADSLPYYVIPYYLTRTNEEGYFELNNLKDTALKIFALRDINKNYLYDLPNEEIAFIDSLLIPEFYVIPEPDTLRTDSIVGDTARQDTIKAESIPADSIVEQLPEGTYYDLFLFQEQDSIQKLTDAKLVKEGKILFVFKYPAEKPIIEVLNRDLSDRNWKIEEINEAKDTINYWIIDPAIDTLEFKISDDTLILDTTKIIVRQEDKRIRKKDEEAEPEFLKVKNNLEAKKLDLDKPFALFFPYPVKKHDFSEILLIEKDDTLKPDPLFTDSIKRKVNIHHDWKEETKYEIFFPDSIFTDIRGVSNDSTSIGFTTKSMGDYGIIRVEIITDSINVCNNIIVQLMDKDENIKRKNIISSTSKINYEYLDPGEYIIKVIFDSNGNGHWDTGDYINKIQPEKVYYFPKSINVRANWEIEEKWKLFDSNKKPLNN